MMKKSLWLIITAIMVSKNKATIPTNKRRQYNGGISGSVSGNGGNGNYKMPCYGKRRRLYRRATIANWHRNNSSNSVPTQTNVSSGLEKEASSNIINFAEWDDSANQTDDWMSDYFFYGDENATNFTEFAGNRPTDGDDPFDFKECEEEEDESENAAEDDDDDVMNDDNFIHNNETAAPIATPFPPEIDNITQAFYDNETSPPTTAPVQNPSMAPSTPAPTLSPQDSAFLDPARVHTFFLQVSTAIPSRGDREIEHLTAKRLLIHVAMVMGEIIQFQSGGEFKPVVERGTPIIDSLLSSSSSSSDDRNHNRGGNGNVSNRRISEQGEKKELRFNHIISNVTYVPVAYRRGESWWLHTVALDTIESNFLEVEEFVSQKIMEAVETGKFEERLARYFKRLKWVRKPGLEGTPLDPMAPMADDSHAPTPVVITAPPTMNAFDSQLDTDWDTRQWIGLSLFSVTFLALLLLTQTAQRRRKKVQEEEQWGIKLGTEHDINQLLTYGWQRDGDHMRVYEKKQGYVDDDSILLGGNRLSTTMVPSSKESSNGVTSKTGSWSDHRGSKSFDASHSNLSFGISALSGESEEDEENPQDDS